MGKFNKTGKREMPALNTSSLPDLIFTLLFFFMIVTTMREVTLKVEFKVPQATELEKLEKKSLVTFIYVGKPTAEFRKKLGNESRIQLNDSYAEVAEIQDYIIGERASMKEEDEESRKILEDFAAFIVEMHEKGMFNLDMNPGNVFFYKSGEKYRFALIDINRIRFCRHLTRNDCVEVFKHLDNLPPPALSVVLVRYAELRQWNPQILCGAVMLRQGFNLPRRIKTGFRSLLSHLGLRK